MTLKSLNEFALQFSHSLPPLFHDIKSEFEEQFRLGLALALQKLDLVTRQELDIQIEVLAKTRNKVEALEQKVAEFEALTLQASPAKNESNK